MRSPAPPAAIAAARASISAKASGQAVNPGETIHSGKVESFMRRQVAPRGGTFKPVLPRIAETGICPRMSKFSYDAVWADLVSMTRTNASLLIALAGVFLLLPSFAKLLFAPPPPFSFDLNAMKAMNEYFRDNVGLLFLLNIPIWLGSAAILALLLDPRKLTVGEALAGSLALLLSVVLLTWITQFAIYGGFLLLVLPGLYLVGRLATAVPALMAERLRNPITALKRSLDLTRGSGWRIAGLVAIVWGVAYILAVAISTVLGIILTLAIPAVGQPAALALLGAALEAGIALLMLLLGAAIYRQLAPAQPVA